MALVTFFVSFFITCLWGYIGYRTAEKKGRNPKLWCVLGVLFGLFAIIVISLLRPKETQKVVEMPKLELEEIVQDNWYFLSHSKETKGPMSFNDFKTEFEAGTFNKQSFVWNETYTDWKKLEEDLVTIKELEKRS